MFKKYRLAKGLSIKRCAELIHVDRKTIQNLESGTLVPSIKTLAKVMTVLEIPGEEIIKYIKDAEKKRL